MAGVTDKVRKILVAVDEGEESSYALSWCVNNIVNQNSKDTLILLYVKAPPVVYATLYGTGEEETSFGGNLARSMDISGRSTVTDNTSLCLFFHFFSLGQGICFLLILWPPSRSTAMRLQSLSWGKLSVFARA